MKPVCVHHFWFPSPLAGFMARRLQHFSSGNPTVQPVSNYRIVVRGIKPGRSVDQIVLSLARYSKKSTPQLRALLTSGKTIVAKRTALAQQAMQYKQFLDKLGCDCLVEAEITGRSDAINSTSVLVTGAVGSDEGPPRPGVTYVQRTRFQELMESLLRPKAVSFFVILVGVLYLGWQRLHG